MLDITPSLKFLRYGQSNGTNIYGVHGRGQDYSNFLSDLYKLDVLFVDAVKPWVYWVFQDPEDELDFVVRYKDSLSQRM